MRRTTYLSQGFTPGSFFSFFGRFGLILILLFNTNIFNSSGWNYFGISLSSNFSDDNTQSSASLPKSSNSSTASVLADTCNPLQVTSNSGNSAQCGTLRYAINFLNSNPANPQKTITLALNSGSEIIPSSGFILPAGVSLSAGCSLSGASVSIIGNGFVGDGLTLSGSNIITGVQVGGFKGVQIKTTGTNNKLSCTKSSTILTPINVTLPPDPGKVAPPIDPTTATDIASSTAFLYTGSNPIQTGVAAGTITSTRVAVLRGKVLDRQNQPISGVKIQILDHSEYGQTLSRADGMFDMGVNGGSSFTVKYTKQGYLDVQRQIDAPWRDFQWLPDVTLTQLDPQVTPVSLANLSTMAVVRGSQITDSDGTRRATLLIPTGTTATMKLGDGSSQPLTNLSIRATEYTVGDSGPNAMPGTLPASSGYTYATEFSVDEAIAAGATQVNFNQPVIQYLENFLNFPVGMIVPAGYYDRKKGLWVPGKNGKVIKIVSISGGSANIDVTGDGVADTGNALSDLGITDAERQQLATLYTAGQSLWRTPLDHFTPWDCNWPYGPPADATPPPPPPPPPNSPGECPASGSIIGCRNQTLGELVGVTGTPFELHYQSDRTNGYKFDRTVQIPLSGGSVPASLKKITVQVEIAGQNFNYEYSPNPNQSLTFTWNGTDAYGRELQGGQTANINVGYVYDAVYQEPSNFAQSFGSLSGVSIVGNRARQESTIFKQYNINLTTWNSSQSGLGNWTLDINHHYDFSSKTLYLGDGTKQIINAIGNGTITTIAGGDNYVGIGDGGPATSAHLYDPHQIAVGPDGSIYIADSGNNRIRKVGPNGIITTIAGNGVEDFSGDGGPATDAALYSPHGIAVGPDGSIYIADTNNSRIRKVGPNGIITTIAGNGDNGPGYSGDEGPATAATLSDPQGVVVGPDGSIFIADTNNRSIRKVGPDGIISTIAGKFDCCEFGDGGPAAAASLNHIYGIAVGPDGSIYFAEGDYSGGNSYISRIRKVGPDGIINTVAGNSSSGFSGDGGPAVAAILNHPNGIAVGPDGSIFIADNDNERIRKVGPDGIIITVAGNGECCELGDGGAATAATLSYPTGIAVGPDGNIYFAGGVLGSNTIRILTSALPGFNTGDFIIPSEDGTEVYTFNSSGKHLRTLNALTGEVLYNFGYNSAGQLFKITDGDNNVTTLDRDSSGNPTAIVAPGGQRTTISINTAGYLASISNPANQSYQFTYTPDGLLTQLIEPGSSTPHTFEYNLLGKLTKDSNGAGGFTNLNRTDNANSTNITVTTAMGRTTTFGIVQPPTGVVNYTNTNPSGLAYRSNDSTDGSFISVNPSGSSSSSILSPNPRFGIEAPLTSSSVYTATPNLVATTTTARSVTLNNPNDPFSLSSQTDTVSINNRTFTQTYTASTKTFTNNSPENRQSTTVIDAKGRVTSEQIAGLDPTAYTYDSQGRLITLSGGSGADTRSSGFSYFGSGASKGYLQTITDPRSGQVSFAYDNAGRVTSQTLPGNRTINYAYDSKGNLTSLTPPGETAHSFVYNNVDLPVTYTAPAVSNGGTNQTSYSYNPDKQLKGITFPDSSSTSLSYDAAGRLSSVTTPNRTVNYSYNPTTGQLTGINVAGSGGPGLAYNYNGSLLSGETFSGPVPGSVSQTFDNNLWVKSQSVNGGNTVNFSYDNDGLLTNAGDLTLIRDPQNGLVTRSDLGNIRTDLTYNNFGELSGYTAKQGSTILYSTTFTRDKLGRITQKSETIGSTTDTYTYSYDPAGRLSGVQKNGVTTANYTYDPNGNRLTGPGGAGGVYDAQGRLLGYGANTYTYNARGDLATKTNGGQTTNYQYDVESNLLGATLPDGTQISYIVDGNNRRIGKKVNGTLVQGFLYQDNLRPIAELDGSGNIVSRFVYTMNSNVPAYMVKGGLTYRLVTDQVGSVRLVIDTSTGAIAQRIDYDEFGNILTNTAPGFQPFGFAGGIYDQNTKLTRFGARDYDAESGRWTTKDPIGFNGGDSNLYVYVSGNPLNSSDSLGLWTGQIGLGYNINLGFVHYSSSIGFAFDGEGNIGNYKVPINTSLGSPGLGLIDSISLQFTNANNICELNGDSFTINHDLWKKSPFKLGPSVSTNAIIGKNYEGAGVNLGFGGEIHIPDLNLDSGSLGNQSTIIDYRGKIQDFRF